jgi:hypothetical protein
MGSLDSKVGITGHPEVRLGVYQNSYSKKSHTACLDVVYVGPARAIGLLEGAIKQAFDWDIERDGRGHSEWVSQQHAVISEKIDELVDGYKFKIKKVPKKYLPLTVDNIENFYKWLDTIK